MYLHRSEWSKASRLFSNPARCGGIAFGWLALSKPQMVGAVGDAEKDRFSAGHHAAIRPR